MEIIVQHLGVIDSAKVDLDKKLTLFCGKNNTGKTYLSYIIYALIQMDLMPSHKFVLSEELIDKLYHRETVIVHLDSTVILDYKIRIAESVIKNVGEVFGIGEDEAARIFPKLNIGFTKSQEELSEKLIKSAIDVTLGSANRSLPKFKIVKTSGTSDIEISHITPVGDSEIGRALFNNFTMYFLPAFVARLFALYPVSKSYCFPVERNSIYTFNDELSISRNTLVEQLKKELQKGTNNPMRLVEDGSGRYPQPIVDGINVANDLSNITKNKGEYYDLAVKIENNILNGSIGLSANGDVVFNSNTLRGRKLPIHLTASLVKTLSSLIFHLKHLAKKNELIIIDEPEMNLHPDTQIALVAVFVELLNNGIRLLVSTHSDYILREINKYVMLGEVPDESMPEFAHGLKLRKEDVGVCYFAPKSNKKVSVKSLPVGKYGFNIPSIDDAADRQNDEIGQVYALI